MGQKINKIQFIQLGEDKEKIQDLINNSELSAIILKKNWQLTNGKYRKFQCKFLFEHIIRLKGVQKLDFSANNQPTIPLQISHLNLFSVLTLNLSGNYICSLQKLSFLRIDYLQVLILDWNFITSLDSFYKTNFIHLQTLIDNPLINLGRFQRTRMSKLKQLMLEDRKQNKETVSDVIWKLSKMRLSSFNLVRIKSGKRIKFDKSPSILAIKRKSKQCCIQRQL